MCCSPVSVGSIPAGKAGWPFQPWEWHTENTSTVFKISRVLLASWVLCCLSLCIFRSHLLSLWSESSDMQQPFLQQQQLKPAMLQQGTVMRCWRDVCSRGEQWVERSDAFWSEVDSNIVWGTACWTADVPFPQCKSLFPPSALLVGAYFFPQTSLPFQNIPFSSSSRQTLTSWAPARTQMCSTYLRIRAAALLRGKAAQTAFCRAGRQQGWQTAGPGCCQQLSWLWRQLDLCKLCLRPSLCPHLQVLVHTCLRVTLSDDA